MSNQLRHKSKCEQGSLMFALIAILFISFIGSMGYLFSRGDIRLAGLRFRTVRVEIAAEEAFNRALERIKAYYNSESTSPRLELDPAPYDPWADEDKTLSETVAEKAHVFVFLPNADIRTEYTIQEPKSWTATGDGGFEKALLINVEAVNQKSGEKRIFEQSLRIKRDSLSKYVIFYEEELGLSDTSCSYLEGKIHTNKNLYIQGPNEWGKCPDGSPATLHITSDSITSAGRIIKSWRKWKPKPLKLIEINGIDFLDEDDSIIVTDMNGFGAIQTESRSCIDNQNGVNVEAAKWKFDTAWYSGITEKFDNVIKDCAHGIATKKVPAIANIEPGGYYDTSSNLRIEYDGAGGVAMHNGALPLTNAEMIDCGIGIDAANKYRGNNNSPNGVDGYFYDTREGMMIKVLDIDIGKLTQCAGADVIVYATRTDAIPDSTPEADPDHSGADGNWPDPGRLPYGFRLHNAETLEYGLTFVTNNPLYLVGSFNRELGIRNAAGEYVMPESQGPADFATHFPATSRDIGAGLSWNFRTIGTKKPAAIIADSLTWLSPYDGVNPNDEISIYGASLSAMYDVKAPTTYDPANYLPANLTDPIPDPKIFPEHQERGWLDSEHKSDGGKASDGNLYCEYHEDYVPLKCKPLSEYDFRTASPRWKNFIYEINAALIVGRRPYFGNSKYNYDDFNGTIRSLEYKRTWDGGGVPVDQKRDPSSNTDRFIPPFDDVALQDPFKNAVPPIPTSAPTDEGVEEKELQATLRVRGSYISLYESQYGTGNWRGKGWYHDGFPRRDIAYDQDYFDPSFQPPGGFLGVTSEISYQGGFRVQND